MALSVAPGRHGRPAPPGRPGSSLRDELSSARAASSANRRGGRRVRHEARDALAVVAFSAGASVAVTLVLTLLLALAG